MGAQACCGLDVRELRTMQRGDEADCAKRERETDDHGGRRRRPDTN
jgi:hypothetical protein